MPGMGAARLLRLSRLLAPRYRNATFAIAARCLLMTTFAAELQAAPADDSAGRTPPFNRRTPGRWKCCFPCSAIAPPELA